MKQTFEDIVTLHGFEIGLDRQALPLPILRAILKGWYEGGEVKLIKSFLKPTDRVIELGAGLGITAMTVASITGADQIFPYELNPHLVDWAKFNFARNGLSIAVRQTALMPKKSISTDVVDFHIHKNFWGSSLLKREGTLETISVPVVALEQAVKEHQANCLLLDIEGAEVDLLVDADLAGIEKIIMEIHYGIAGRARTEAMMRHLANQGFSLDLMLSSGGVIALYRDGVMGS